MPVSLTSKRTAARPPSVDPPVTRTRTSPARGELDRVADAGSSSTWRTRAPSPRTRRRHARASIHDRDSTPFSGAAAAQSRPRSSISLVEVERRPVELELAGLDLREVEDVVDDARAASRPSCASRRRTRAARASSSVSSSSPAIADHAVHRRADLVAHVGHELRLEAGRLERLLVGAVQPLLVQLELRQVGEGETDASLGGHLESRGAHLHRNQPALPVHERDFDRVLRCSGRSSCAASAA